MPASDRSSPGSPAAIPPEPWWRPWACFVLLLVAIQVALGHKIALSQWTLTADNAAVAEGLAWVHGRLDLHEPAADGPEPEKRRHDTAYVDGKVYNVFPPMMAFWTALLYPLHHTALGMPEGLWLQTTYLAVVFCPLPVVGFIAFRRQTGDSAWAALLTLAWLGGTAVLPNLAEARFGYLGQINHVVSQVGLLILATDLLGRQRIWPGLIGLAIATYTRQLTFLYGLPLLYVAWRQGKGRLLGCLVGLAIVAAPLLTLNYLKFGNPVDFGYREIYVGRPADDDMAARCREYGTFSPRCIPHNFRAMHLTPPLVEIDFPFVKVGPRGLDGVSMWLTTPLAVWAILAAGWWWRDPSRRIVMCGTLPVMVGLLCYHSPGFMQSGYSRFALDFLPLWLLVVAPVTRGGWRSWLTLACVAWSLLYFNLLLQDIPIQVKTHGPV